jgi:hypothetical protein
LSLQATINRVSDEVKNISLDLFKELQLTNAELRTGISREAALRNLGERSGVQNVQALVGLMIQSDKMGASIVKSLRTHAAFLRVKRSQQAEEQAAKLPVKIRFLPVHFSAIFVVLLGASCHPDEKLIFNGINQGGTRDVVQGAIRRVARGWGRLIWVLVPGTFLLGWGSRGPGPAPRRVSDFADAGLRDTSRSECPLF